MQKLHLQRRFNSKSTTFCEGAVRWESLSVAHTGQGELLELRDPVSASQYLGL